MSHSFKEIWRESEEERFSFGMKWNEKQSPSWTHVQPWSTKEIVNVAQIQWTNKKMLTESPKGVQNFQKYCWRNELMVLVLVLVHLYWVVLTGNIGFVNIVADNTNYRWRDNCIKQTWIKANHIRRLAQFLRPSRCCALYWWLMQKLAS